MSDVIAGGDLYINSPIYPRSGPSGSGGDNGPGGSSYNPWNSGPPTSGGSGNRGPGSGGSNPAPANPPTPTPGISSPYIGRVTSNAPLEFLTFDGYHGATGTAQQILDQLPALFRYNDDRSKDWKGNLTPLLRVPGGHEIRFDNTVDLKTYLTRSAAPLVPTATVSATFQGVMGRPPSPAESDQAQSVFNNGKSLADYRAGLIAAPETTNTLRGVSLQVLGREASATELDAFRRQLNAGTSVDGLRADLARTAEATAGVTSAFQSVLGRPASAADIANRETLLGTNGSQAALRQDLAMSQQARNAVTSAFRAELGRAASDQNVADMQGSLAAPNGSLDGVRTFLAGTQEARAGLTVIFQNELGRAASDQNIADMQHSLAASGGSLAGVQSFLATTSEATGKLNETFQTVLGRAAQPNDTALMQSTLARNESYSDVRASLAMSPESAAKIGAAYQGACGQAPSQATVQCAQSLLALGVPSGSMQSILVDAAKSTTAPPDTNGNPAEQHGLFYHFFNDLWNTATQQIPNDVANIISDFVKDPGGTAQRLGPSLGGFGAVAGEVPGIVQGLYGGFKLLGATPSTPATIETERQRLANLIHQRNLGTDPAIGTFRANEAATGIRLEQKLGRELSRYVGRGADYVDSFGTTYDPVGPVPPQFFDIKSFTNQIIEHLNKQGLDRTVIDMTGAPIDQINSVESFLSGLSSQQLGRIITLGF